MLKKDFENITLDMIWSEYNNTIFFMEEGIDFESCENCD